MERKGVEASTMPLSPHLPVHALELPGKELRKGLFFSHVFLFSAFTPHLLLLPRLLPFSTPWIDTSAGKVRFEIRWAFPLQNDREEVLEKEGYEKHPLPKTVELRIDEGVWKQSVGVEEYIDICKNCRGVGHPENECRHLAKGKGLEQDALTDMLLVKEDFFSAEDLGVLHAMSHSRDFWSGSDQNLFDLALGYDSWAFSKEGKSSPVRRYHTRETRHPSTSNQSVSELPHGLIVSKVSFSRDIESKEDVDEPIHA
ncbi:hypothetical protein SUGI_0276490 [Cryptomeria japonica]|nr:hypothetical protein SUGI_0276490 [Cryptomeria japonica]